MAIGATTERDFVSSAEVGDRLRQCRKLKGLSQIALARLIGVSYQQLQKYEKGQNRLSLSRLVDIAKALNIDMSAIAGPGDPITAFRIATDKRDVATPDISVEQVGRRLRLLREYHGISQSGLAAKIGVSHQQVQKYESGVNQLSLPRLLDICRALGVDLPAIIGPEAPMIGKSKKEVSKIEVQAEALLKYFKAIKSDELRDEVITHAKRLATLK